MGRPKQSVILFLVEGRSDREALERPILSLLQDSGSEMQAAFLVAKTDVTSDGRNTPENLLSKINRFYFEPFFSANPFFYPKDIIEVVQISDLDGAFIPDEFCQMYDEEHWDDHGFIYAPPFIFGESAESVASRNHRKAENLLFLASQRTIKVKSKTVPYSLYFFSSNIDHFLHDKYNLLDREKVDLAGRFADRCNEDINVFLDTICKHPAALHDMTYEESWDFISRNGSTESLQRHTNFNLYINDLLKKIHYLEDRL